jgi:uncharacterized protein (DUF302 family)
MPQLAPIAAARAGPGARVRGCAGARIIAVRAGLMTYYLRIGREVPMSGDKTVDGMMIVRTGRSVPDVVQRLQDLMKARGIRVFAHLDFSADAAAEGIRLRPTQLLIVGNPKAGTPLIEAQPSVAIDLPLKILVWSDEGTHVAFNDPAYLRRRHGFPAELDKNISGLAALVAQAAGE